MTRDPRREKDLDYARQARSSSAHGFRKHWPERKAAVHRAYRSRWRGYLSQGDAEAAERVVRRGREENVNAEPLSYAVAETLARRLDDRLTGFVANGPYDPAVHRERIVVPLTAILRHRPQRGRRMHLASSVIDGLLPEPVHPHRETVAELARRAWFADFLADRPEFQARLTSWAIQSQLP